MSARTAGGAIYSFPAAPASLAAAGRPPDPPDMELVKPRLSAVESGLGRLDGRMDRLESKIDGLDARLSGKIDALDSKFSGKIDGLDGRLRAVEQKLAAVDASLTLLVNSIVGKLPSWWQMPAVIGSTVVMLVALYALIEFLRAHGLHL